MNAIVEVATATLEMTANKVLCFALVIPPVFDGFSVTHSQVATSAVVSIGGTSISAVAPDHINYDRRLALAVA